MGRCSAYGCKSGYDKHKTAENVSMHQFPINHESLLKKWLHKISWQDFTPTKASKLCSLHFTDNCFITTSEDSNSRRIKQQGTSDLKRKKLKSDAVPTLFPNCPKYMSSEPPKKRSKTSSASARREQVGEDAERMSELFLQKDKVTSIHDIYQRIQSDLASMLSNALVKTATFAKPPGIR